MPPGPNPKNCPGTAWSWWPNPSSPRPHGEPHGCSPRAEHAKLHPPAALLRLDAREITQTAIICHDSHAR